MNTKLDKFGRIIIPKEIRDDLGFVAGMKFDVMTVDGELHVKPVDSRPVLVNRDGVLIYTGLLMENLDIPSFIKEQRVKRDQNLMK